MENEIKFLCIQCKSSHLIRQLKRLVCKNLSCGAIFPILNNTPVLLSDGKSTFQFQDVIDNCTYSQGSAQHSILYQWLVKRVPNISSNTATSRVIEKLSSLLGPDAKVLNVGVLNGGAHLEYIYQNHHVFNVDITPNNSLLCVCDLHDLPFFDNTFDCVIVQNVLEHVLDPSLCVKNIHRVLRNGGIVYSETPFMQQVHAGKFDYTRFTKRGHIYLFKNFEIIDSGWVAGPATAMTWAIENFFLSFAIARKFKKVSLTLTRFFFFWIKYFDYLWKNDSSRSVGASSTYCLVKKSDNNLTMAEFMKIEA
jgi:SAM-dependent methyltransferase